jgi:hypothetical protein
MTLEELEAMMIVVQAVTNKTTLLPSSIQTQSQIKASRKGG